MPVQLPNPPTGPTLLPPPPQDPPTLVDISNAAVYHKQILDSYGKACFSFFCWISPFFIDMLQRQVLPQGMMLEQGPSTKLLLLHGMQMVGKVLPQMRNV